MGTHACPSLTRQLHLLLLSWHTRSVWLRAGVHSPSATHLTTDPSWQDTFPVQYLAGQATAKGGAASKHVTVALQLNGGCSKGGAVMDASPPSAPYRPAPVSRAMAWEETTAADLALGHQLSAVLGPRPEAGAKGAAVARALTEAIVAQPSPSCEVEVLIDSICFILQRGKINKKSPTSAHFVFPFSQA